MMSKRKDWRKSIEYRIWRARVIRRDKRCQVCGSIKHREAHHMNKASYFKDQRFDVNNGICLCHDCHRIFHTSFKRSYRQKCTKEDMKQFFELLTNLKLKHKTDHLNVKNMLRWQHILKQEIEQENQNKKHKK